MTKINHEKHQKHEMERFNELQTSTKDHPPKAPIKFRVFRVFRG
jgi:hypothetical protein